MEIYHIKCKYFKSCSGGTSESASRDGCAQLKPNVTSRNKNCIFEKWKKRCLMLEKESNKLKSENKITNDNITDVQKQIVDVCNEIKNLLLEKNKAYGNSAIEPMRIFSKANQIEQLNIRIDDKLSRISKGQAAGEDAETDLIGYLILKKVAQKMNNTQ